MDRPRGFMWLTAGAPVAAISVAASLVGLGALAAYWCLLAASVDMVFLDDLTLLRPLGHTAALEYVIEPHHDHRLILPKSVLLAVLWLSERLWAVRWVTPVVLFAGAGTLLGLVRAIRGRFSVTDVVLVVLLAGPQLAFSWVHAFDLQFALHTWLLALTVWLALRGAAGEAFARVGAAVTLGLLALTGIHGLIAGVVFAPFVALYAAGRREDRVSVWRFWGFTVGVSWLLVAALFPWDAALSGSATLSSRITTALQFLVVGFGAGARNLWPWSAPVVVGLLLACGLLSAHTRSEQPDELARDRLLQGAFVASLAVALGVGWGRAGWGGSSDAGLASRFVALSASVGVFAYLLLVRAQMRGGRGKVARSLGLVMLAWFAVAFPGSLAHARTVVHAFKDDAARFAQSVEGGSSVVELVQAHPGIYPYDREAFAEFTAVMCERRLGPYRGIASTDCERGRFPTEAVDAATSEGVELLEAGYDTLSKHDHECTGETRSGPACTRAIHELCVARGHATGFGPVENDERKAMLACLPPRLTTHLLSTHLGGMVPTTFCSPERPDECAAAAHHQCLARGAASGLFVSQQPNPQVTCLGPSAEMKQVGFGALQRIHSGCAEHSRLFTPDCFAAIHRYCREYGGQSGFPVGTRQEDATIVCLSPTSAPE